MKILTDILTRLNSFYTVRLISRTAVNTLTPDYKGNPTAFRQVYGRFSEGKLSSRQTASSCSGSDAFRDG